jgi:hypothetical protein
VRATLGLGKGYALRLETGLSVPLLRRQFTASSPDHIVGETPSIAPMAGLGIAYE